MSTEIKNTLFRFVSTRAPELLEKKQVDARFVRHPDPASTQNHFLKSIATATNKTKKQVIGTAAASFAAGAFKTREDVKNILTADFFDFAIWLSSNRATLTKDQVTAVLPAIPVISTAVQLRLWDNLFYQIITFKSGYVREAILSVLVADLFLKNMAGAKGTKNLRKLAQARVIIPQELFGLVTIPSKEAALQKHLDELNISTRHLDADTKRAVAASRLGELEKIAKELRVVSRDYEKQNNAAYKGAQSDHAKAIADAYKAATPDVQTYTDKETGLTKKAVSYAGLALPEFSFTPLVQLDTVYLAKRMSNDSRMFIDELKKTGISTFAEAFEVLEAGIQQETETVFAQSNLRRPMTLTPQLPGTDGLSTSEGDGSGHLVGGGQGTIGGTTPHNSGLTVNNPVFKINSSGITYGRKSSLLLVMDNMPPGTDVTGAVYSVTTNGGITITGSDDFTDSWVNGKLNVTLFNVNKIDTNGPQSITLAGTLQLSNGDTITIQGTCNKTIEWIPYLQGTEGTYRGNGVFTYVPVKLTDEQGDDIPSNGSLIEYKPSGFGVKRLGITDYRKVEQEVCCYVPGEVSNIENVMAREYKEKSTRRLRRTEDTLTTSKEQEKEKLTDTSTTDRFEMNREVSNLLAEDTSIGAHASFTASWGGGVAKYGLQTGADFAHNTTKEQSNSQAITQAKEITERALERVVQKVKEERIVKIIEEYEENNKHGYDNREGNQHISGVYRWVDKIYKNRVVNYGKRLMYEFMIPEPAAFHDVALTVKGLELPAEPVDPRVGDGLVKISTHKSLNSNNYEHWAAVYNAEVTPCPEKIKYIGKTFVESLSGGDEKYKDSVDLDVPEGYYTTHCTIDYALKYDGDGRDLHAFGMSAGNFKHAVTTEDTADNNQVNSVGHSLNPYFDKIHVGYAALNYRNVSINISIKTELSPEAEMKWRVETFNAIIAAYQEHKDAFDAKVAEIKGAIIQKAATNPLFYRQIENMALRKNCIAYLADHANMGGMDMLTARDTMGVNAVYKEERLEKYAAFVKFFEQAFEWELMSYYFYPFYWANQAKWKALYNIDNDDALFRSFLQSGMARVILTVRPGFEETVNWYIATGQIWNGGQVPTLDDPLFLSIVEEMKDPEGQVEETWESRVPTSLTVLQAGTIGLDVTGLPCNPECDEYKVYDEDGKIVNTLSNPISQKKFEIGKAYNANGEEIPQTPEGGE